MGSNLIVPPGGFAGFSQMTGASRAALGAGQRRSGTTNRRRRKKSSGRKRTSSRKKKSGGGGRKMKFGSPAWQKKYKVGKYKK